MKAHQPTGSRFLAAAVFSIAFLLPSISGAVPNQFPKISFLEPYVYLYKTAESTQALTYYGQMDSCGLNVIVGYLNPTTSPHVGSLQYYNNWGPKTASGVSLFATKGGGAGAILQAEEDNPERSALLGYWFTPTTGEEVQDAGALGGDPLNNARRGRAGFNSAGYLMTGLTGCGKNCVKRPNYKKYYAKFRMKVSNNTLPDTVCDIYLKVTDNGPNPLTVVAHKKANDFPDTNYHEFEIWGYGSCISQKQPPNPCNTWGSFGWVELQVYWRGNVDLYVDQVD